MSDDYILAQLANRIAALEKRLGRHATHELHEEPASVTPGHVIEWEDTPLAQRANLNFIGDRVTATDNGVDDTDITSSSPMIFDGDMEYRKATATQGANIALGADGVTCTAYDWAGNHNAPNCIDGDTGTYDSIGTYGAGTSYHQIDLLVAHTIWGYRYRIYEPTPPRNATISIFASNDAITWTTIVSSVTVDTADGVDYVQKINQAFAAPATARYFKFQITGSARAPNPDRVSDIELYEAAAPTYFSRLGYLEDGAVLVGSGGYPAWLSGSIIRLSTTSSVDMQTAASTTLYTVPTGRTAYITAVVIRNPSATLAGGTSYGFTNWRTGIDLSSMTTSSTDYMVIHGADVTKYTNLSAGTNFQITVTTGSTGAATARIDVFGFLRN